MKARDRRRLTYAMVGIISLIVIILMIFAVSNQLGQIQNPAAHFVKQEFTENYCKQLLANHDPDVSGMMFDDTGGKLVNVSISGTTIKTTTLDFAAGTLSGCSLSSILPTGNFATNKFQCEDNTISYSSQETDNYFFIEKSVFIGGVYQTSVHYYNPDSRASYDSDLGEIMSEVIGCTKL